nr:MAG TPA: hypothetical protein [Caudoviricetes sp.]
MTNSYQKEWLNRLEQKYDSVTDSFDIIYQDTIYNYLISTFSTHTRKMETAMQNRIEYELGEAKEKILYSTRYVERFLNSLSSHLNNIQRELEEKNRSNIETLSRFQTLEEKHSDLSLLYSYYLFIFNFTNQKKQGLSELSELFDPNEVEKYTKTLNKLTLAYFKLLKNKLEVTTTLKDVKRGKRGKNIVGPMLIDQLLKFELELKSLNEEYKEKEEILDIQFNYLRSKIDEEMEWFFTEGEAILGEYLYEYLHALVYNRTYLVELFTHGLSRSHSRLIMRYKKHIVELLGKVDQSTNSKKLTPYRLKVLDECFEILKTNLEPILTDSKLGLFQNVYPRIMNGLMQIKDNLDTSAKT